MGEKILYEYCVLRYVADIEREEFVNIGLMMMSKRYRWFRCECHIDEPRLKSFFQKTDLQRLRTQLAVFAMSGVPFPDLPVEERYRWLAAVKSAMIQTSPSHPGIIPLHTDETRPVITRMLDEKFDDLFSRLVR